VAPAQVSKKMMQHEALLLFLWQCMMIVNSYPFCHVCLFFCSQVSEHMPGCPGTNHSQEQSHFVCRAFDGRSLQPLANDNETESVTVPTLRSRRQIRSAAADRPGERFGLVVKPDYYGDGWSFTRQCHLGCDDPLRSNQLFTLHGIVKWVSVFICNHMLFKLGLWKLLINYSIIC